MGGVLAPWLVTLGQLWCVLDVALVQRAFIDRFEKRNAVGRVRLGRTETPFSETGTES